MNGKLFVKFKKKEKCIIRKYDIASELILKRRKIESCDHIESFVDGCKNDEERLKKSSISPLKYSSRQRHNTFLILTIRV